MYYQISETGLIFVSIPLSTKNKFWLTVKNYQSTEQNLSYFGQTSGNFDKQGTDLGTHTFDTNNELQLKYNISY